MDITNIVLFIVGAILSIAIGQNEAGGNIGNRSYSSWYETHCLVRRTGICRLIYYKPKHFGRYTLYEVVSFFASFLLPVILGIISLLVGIGVLFGEVLNIIVGVISGLFLINQLIIMLINDIGSWKDDKKRFYLETGTREVCDFENLPLTVKDKNSKLTNKIISLGIQQGNNSYFTIYNLRDSYNTRIKKAKNDIAKIESINREYINYFKNIEKLVVLKENKDGTLVFRK